VIRIVSFVTISGEWFPEVNPCPHTRGKGIPLELPLRLSM
jgi:hypothetical protein